MFQGRRARAEMLDLVRAEVRAARAEMQASLVEAHSSVAAAVSDLGAQIQVESDERERIGAALLAALQRVTEACDLVARRIQIDHVNRTVLLDAVAQLTAALPPDGFSSRPAPALEPSVLEPPLAAVRVDGALADPLLRSSVVGGTVTPAHEPIDEVILPNEDERPPDTVAVHSRFGGGWVDGFEICEIVEFADGVRFRLRRCSDGYVLPTLFDEDEVRGRHGAAVARSARDMPRVLPRSDGREPR